MEQGNVTREQAINEKIFELFLFVVSEVSTGRRCLSLALFFRFGVAAKAAEYQEKISL